MAEFDVSLESSRRQADGFEGCSRQLKSCADQLRDISSSLHSLGESTSSIKAALRTASAKVDDEQRCAQEMGEKLLSIMSQYDATEKKICGYKQPLKNMQLTQTQAAGSGALAGAADGEAEDERSAWDKIQDYVANRPLEGLGQLLSRLDNKSDAAMLMWLATADPILLLPLVMMPEKAQDYMWDATKQMVFGDFVEESNLLGTVASVVTGAVFPVVGLIANCRDLAAGIIKSNKEPTKENWLSLAITTVGVLPDIGELFKYGDKVGDVAGGILKHFDIDSADEIADGVKSVLKSGNDVISAVGKGISGFMDANKGLQKIVTNVSGLTVEGRVSKVLEAGKDLAGEIDCEDINKILNKIDWDDAAEGGADIIKDWTGWDDFKEEQIGQPIFDVFTDYLYNLRWGPQAAPAT